MDPKDAVGLIEGIEERVRKQVITKVEEALTSDEAVIAAMRVWNSYTSDTMLDADKARLALRAALATLTKGGTDV
jgi:hypothetical protein